MTSCRRTKPFLNIKPISFWKNNKTKEHQWTFPIYVFTDLHPVNGSKVIAQKRIRLYDFLLRVYKRTLPSAKYHNFKFKNLKRDQMSVIVCHGIRTDFLHCWLQFHEILETDLIIKIIRKQVIFNSTQTESPESSDGRAGHYRTQNWTQKCSTI